MAFRDIQAQAPTHVLVIPKKEIVNVAGLEEEDAELAGRLLLAVGKVAKQLGVDDLATESSPISANTADNPSTTCTFTCSLAGK